MASKLRDKTLRLWDAATGVLQRTLKDCSSSVNSVTFSSDDKIPNLYVSTKWIVEKGIKLWLPPDYRATSVAIWNNRVALEHSSGNISFFKFVLERKLT